MFINYILNQFTAVYKGDLKPHVTDIVEHLSWKDMEKVALETGMKSVLVERHKQNNPGDEEQQVRSLLNAWIEEQGLNQASETFFKTLRKCKLNRKAEEIERVIREKRSPIDGVLRDSSHI